MEITRIKILATTLLSGLILFNAAPLAFAQNIVDPVNGQCSSGFTKFRFQTTVRDGVAGTVQPFDKCVKRDSPQYQQVIKNAKQVGDAYEASAQSYNEVAGDAANLFNLRPGGSVTQRVSGYQMSVPIPCQPIAGGQCPRITSPATYIARLYQFGLMVAGLAAFGSIVYGALQYTLSAGSFTKTEDAKEQIKQAILGLVLLLGAFLILYTINPSIVQLRDPNVQFLDVDELIQRGSTGGLEQRLGGAPEPHPLCKFGTYTGLSVTVGGSGNLAPSFVCHECKTGAVPAGTSDCKCDVGFVMENNQCIRPVGVTAPELLPPAPSQQFQQLPPGGGVLLP